LACPGAVRPAVWAREGGLVVWANDYSPLQGNLFGIWDLALISLSGDNFQSKKARNCRLRDYIFSKTSLGLLPVASKPLSAGPELHPIIQGLSVQAR